jgi:hypothetical protein
MSIVFTAINQREHEVEQTREPITQIRGFPTFRSQEKGDWLKGTEKSQQM